MPSTRILAVVASVLTLAATIGWLATDRHHFTKFAVVEEVELAVPEDDPLAETGFYDEGTKTEPVRRKEFHLGLLPTPQGIFDRHAISVLSICGPLWALAAAAFLWRRRRGDPAAIGGPAE